MFSGLNELKDISELKNYPNIIGFTEEEIL